MQNPDSRQPPCWSQLSLNMERYEEKKREKKIRGREGEEILIVRSDVRVADVRKCDIRFESFDFFFLFLFFFPPRLYNSLVQKILASS